MKTEAKIEGLAELEKSLELLSEEYRGKSLYQSLMYATNPMYATAKRKAPNTIEPYKRYVGTKGSGKYVMQQPGLLRKSIKRKRLTKKSREAHRVAVGIAIEYSGKTGQTPFYWHMIENGTSKMAARPFMRPAYDMHKDATVERFKDKLFRAIVKHNLK